MTGAKAGKIIAYVLVVLALVSAIGFIAYFTGGFTSGFKTFYVEVDGKQVLTNASGYSIPHFVLYLSFRNFATIMSPLYTETGVIAYAEF